MFSTMSSFKFLITTNCAFKTKLATLNNGRSVRASLCIEGQHFERIRLVFNIVKIN